MNNSFLQFDMAKYLHRPKKAVSKNLPYTPPAEKVHSNASVRRQTDLINPTKDPSCEPILYNLNDKYPDYNELSYMIDPADDDDDGSKDIAYEKNTNEFLASRINPCVHDYRLADHDVIDNEKYRMFPHSNVPITRQQYDQLEQFKIYPHMYTAHSKLRDNYDNAEFQEPKEGAVQYPIPMHMQLRVLQKQYPKNEASGADHEMIICNPNTGMPGKYIMPKPHSRNSGVSLMPHYLEAHPASDKRMPRLIQPQLPPGFYGEYIPCTDAAANTSNSYIQRQCKTQNKDLGTFSVYNTDNVRISKVPAGLISPKCKENSQVRFFSNSGLKGTEYIMANKSGCYKFEYNKKGNIPLKSFLIPKGWILKIIYNNNNKKQAHEYIGLRAVQNFSKPQTHIHSICIVKL